MITKILEPLIYLLVWIHYHVKLLAEAIVKFVKFLFVKKVRLSIHTFIGALLTILYCYIFTGKIDQFHGFHDALPALQLYGDLKSGGVGAIFLIALASLLLIMLTRGFFVFIGYTLIFWLYVILSSFETPARIEPPNKHALHMMEFKEIKSPYKEITCQKQYIA